MMFFSGSKSWEKEETHRLQQQSICSLCPSNSGVCTPTTKNPASAAVLAAWGASSNTQVSAGTLPSRDRKSVV